MPMDAQRFEESLLEFTFGDGELDPGPLVHEGARNQVFRDRIDQLVVEVGTLKSALGVDGERSDAVARLTALAAECDRLREKGTHADRAPAEQAEVVDFAAARARKNKARFYGGGALLALAAGLALFFIMQGTPTSRTTTNDQPPGLAAETAKSFGSLAMDDARTLARAVPESAHGFAGQKPLTAFGKGYFVGLVRDLSSIGVDQAPDVVGMARTQADALSDRVLSDVETAPESDAERRELVVKGCASLLPADPNRTACLQGAFAYRMLRDITVGRPEATARGKSQEAKAFLTWLESDAPVDGELRAAARALRTATDEPPAERLTRWQKVLTAATRLATP